MTLPVVSKSKFNVIGFTVRHYMMPGEQDVFLALVKSVAPRVMVEIGINIGLTAQAVLRDVPTIEHYYGVDIPADYQFEIPAQAVERPDQPGRLVRDDPRFRLVLRGEKLPLVADVVFVDGDHGRNAVRQDAEWAERVTLPGGLIIYHDYGNPTVKVTEVLDELHAGGREIYHVAHTWLAFEPR